MDAYPDKVDSGPGLPIRLPIALTIAMLVAIPTMLPAAPIAATEQLDELVLTMAATGNGATVVRGYLNSTPGTQFTINFSSSPTCVEPGTQFASSTHTTDPNGHIAFTTSVDMEIPAGDEAVTATATTGGLKDCVSLVRDSAPPTVSMGDLPTFQTQLSFPVTWQGSDQTEVKFDVLFRQAHFNGGFGGDEGFILKSTATSETFVGKPGRSYCFRALANDLLGNTSSTGEECTAVLVDDSSMKHRKGFKQRSGGDHFMATFSWAKRKGATLILSGVRADQLALLIDRCKRCGKVRVTFPGMKRRVSLKGPKQTQVLVFVGDLASRTPGTLRIKSLTDRPVRVDGVGISAV